MARAQLEMTVAATPFPSRQLFILALCRICEPIAFMSIFPYVYYMILDFNITTDDRQVAIYTGLVTSAFAFAEFSTGILWGKLSDNVGRKPILLTGLAGTGLSMILFGFAPSLPVALLARALGGLLNGNIGVLQTTVAEVVKQPEHRPRAFSIMPFVWCLGGIVGSGLGGTLAQPVKNYPRLFARNTIFERFPFLLPNLVCAVIVLFSLTVGVLFLEETHEAKKYRRDPGREFGSWLLTKAGRSSLDLEFEKVDEANFDEIEVLITGDERIAAPRASHVHSSSSLSIGPREARDVEADTVHGTLTLRTIFNRQVVLAIIAYGILAFHTISAEQLLPVLLSMRPSEQPPTMPFSFTGGFGFSTKTIGVILSIQGVYQMAVQLFLFPRIVTRFGSLATLRFIALSYAALYAVVPFLVLLPNDATRLTGLALCLVWKVTYQSLAYPSLALQLTGAAPSLVVLGTINGVAASTASLCRALGPTLSGLVQSLGIRLGIVGLPWWASAAMCLVGAVECLGMKEVAGGKTVPGSSRAEHEPSVDDLAPELSSRKLSDSTQDSVALLAEKSKE